jgi:catechol 2,3-dioxygenase-like lactoylglutathione lyase family enzyme
MPIPVPMPLDHVVIAAHDLDRTSADFRALGFNVQPGGQHAAPRTSHNALIVFADGSYIELIAWRSPPPPPEPWHDHLQTQGQGLVDFALLPHDTTAVIQAAHARGLHSLSGPYDGGRTRPDGQSVVWQTARHDSPDLPFLCGDITPRALRVVTDPGVRTHANGATGISGLTIAALDVAVTRRRYEALLGLPVGLTGTSGAEPPVASAIDLPGCTLHLQACAPGHNEGPVAIRFSGAPAQVGLDVSAYR